MHNVGQIHCILAIEHNLNLLPLNLQLDIHSCPCSFLFDEFYPMLCLNGLRKPCLQELEGCILQHGAPPKRNPTRHFLKWSLTAIIKPSTLLTSSWDSEIGSIAPKTHPPRIRIYSRTLMCTYTWSQMHIYIYIYIIYICNIYIYIYIYGDVSKYRVQPGKFD